jgi:tetratricopeptide (TPR) repeat protein
MNIANLAKTSRPSIPGLAILSIMLMGGSPPGALAQGSALERCRETVGKAIVQSCMQSGGGNLQACRQKASPRVRACVQAAGGSGGSPARGKAAGPSQKFAAPGGNSPARPTVGKARQLIMTGQYMPAIGILDKAITQDPSFSFAYMWRGTAKQRMGQFQESLPDYDQALKLDPKNAYALSGRGYTYYMLKDNTRALADANAAGEIDSDLPGPYATRGLVYSEMGDQTRALDELNKSIKADPKYLPAYIGLGIVYNKQQEYEKAIDAYTKVITALPKSFGIRNGRGFAYQNVGDNDRALADFNEVIKLNPRFTRTYVNRGRIYIEKGDFDAAIKDFDEALRQAPQSIPALLQRARAYEAKRDLATAKADFESVLSIASTHPVALAGRERLDAKLAGRSQDARPPGAGGRVALVVGNSQYKTFDTLTNPRRDAKLVSEALGRAGFGNVQLVSDASKEGLSNALRVFAEEAAKADWAVVYFAGHGIELDGNNYLVPVDAKYENDADIPVESIALDQVLNAVNGAARMRLVILDACRENPFVTDQKKGETTNAGRGLARIEPESGTLVAFATKHGHLASDGSEQNSPFAASLAKRIDTPGLEINRLFRLVHDDVYTSTGKKQEPFTYGQLSAEEFYFRSR